MAKQASTKDETATAPRDEIAVVAEAGSGTDVTPKMALAGTVKPAAPQPAQQLPLDLSPVTIELSASNGSHSAKLESIRAPEPTHPEPASDGPAEEPAGTQAGARPGVSCTSPRINRFTLLAACLALSAAFGSMVGALVAFAIARPQPVSLLAARLTPEEVQALKENVVQARVELAALKATLDAGNRGTATSLTKIADRVERMERSGAEPTAKLSKAAEALERLARNEFTGAISPPPQAVPAGATPKLEGWVLRDVHHGVAYLEGRSGMIEVEQGDIIPGVGRVESIRKQDGRWIVVTSKGVLSASR